jgi:hypothetical protein
VTPAAGIGVWASVRTARVLRMLAVLAFFALPLACAASASAAEDGQITGRVTDASTHAAITGIEVCARGAHEFVSCESVNGYGEYVLYSVPPGSYAVEVYSRYPSINYVFQEVVGVVVAADESREVNAAMQLGGWIAGKVTDSSTNVAVAGVTVCLESSNGVPLSEGHLGDYGCAQTGSDGEYIISRVPPGAYGVFFAVPIANVGELDYAAQYYGGGSHRDEGREVTVVSGQTTGEVDAAMLRGGHITGVVTDTVTGAVIEGLSVCTSGLEEKEPTLMVRCGASNSHGEYAITALASGEYTVEFHAPLESALNYLPQFYGEQPVSPDGGKVSVTAGETTSGIDAAMQPGGIIMGTVTAAATGTVIAGVEVCVVAIGNGAKLRCVNTNADGEYVVAQLPAGEDTVEFAGAIGEHTGYARQFYGGKTALSEADHLPVTPGVTLTGINAGLRAVEEETVKAPSPAETTLSADLASATSLVKATPLVTVATSKLVVSKGSARVPIACAQAACQGSVELTVQVAAKRHRRKSALARNGRAGATLVLATGSFSLADGEGRSVLLRLTAVGKNMLADASRRHHPIAGKLVLSVRGGRARTTSVLAI